MGCMSPQSSLSDKRHCTPLGTQHTTPDLSPGIRNLPVTLRKPPPPHTHPAAPTVTLLRPSMKRQPVLSHLRKKEREGERILLENNTQL